MFWKRLWIAMDHFSRRKNRITELSVSSSFCGTEKTIWYRYHGVNKLFSPIADQHEASLHIPGSALKVTEERHVLFRMCQSRNSNDYWDARFKYLRFYMDRRSRDISTRRDL